MFSQFHFFKPLDALLILLISIGAAWGFFSFPIAEGAKAVVYVGNKKYGWYDLSAPKHVVSIPTRIGKLDLEIGAGSARVIASSCVNKICMKGGAIHLAHSEIICLPSYVRVVVEGDGPKHLKSEIRPDAITF